MKKRLLLSTRFSKGHYGCRNDGGNSSQGREYDAAPGRIISRLMRKLTRYKRNMSRENGMTSVLCMYSRLFQDTDPALEASYDAWVGKYPQSYAAHQARAIYFCAIVENISNSVNDFDNIPDQEKTEMQHYESVAFDDNQAAIALTPKPLMAYDAMIRLGWLGRQRDLAAGRCWIIQLIKSIPIIILHG